MLRKKLTNVGFEDVRVHERRAFGLGALARYPLFPADFLEFVRRVVSADRHDTLLFSIVVTARTPDA